MSDTLSIVKRIASELGIKVVRVSPEEMDIRFLAPDNYAYAIKTGKSEFLIEFTDDSDSCSIYRSLILFFVDKFNAKIAEIKQGRVVDQAKLNAALCNLELLRQLYRIEKGVV